MRYFTAPGEDRQLESDRGRGLRGSFIELPSGVTHYELTGPGDGDVVVLVGGLTVPLFYWDGLVAELHSRGLRTLAYSLYGRGYSDRVRARYDEALFARQLAELLDALTPNQPLHMVGASMGALVSMAYSQTHRASVATLTVAGPAGLATQKMPLHWLLNSDLLAEFMARRFGSRLLENHLGHNVRDPERGAELTAMVLNAYRYEGSMYAFFDTLQHLQSSGRTALYRDTGELGVPTLLIWGADDQVTPVDAIGTAQALLKPQQTHVIPDCGHMVPFERPSDVAAMIGSFTASNLERHDS